VRNIIGIILSVWVFGLSATAALTDFDRQELPDINGLAPFNSGFESGIAQVTASGGTLAAVTSGSNLLTGKGSITWNSTAASQTLTGKAWTIPNGMKGKNCEVALDSILTPSGTATHTFSAWDGTNTLASIPIVSSTTPVKASVNVPCTTSGTLTWRLTSVAADEPLIAIDDAWVGGARNVGSVAQAELYGAIKYAGTASCSWTTGDTGSNLTDFLADTDCPAPTTYGNASAPATKVPRIKFASLPPGRYQVIVSALSATETNSVSATGSFRAYDGTTNSGHKFFEVNSAAQITVDASQLIGFFEYTTAQTNIEFRPRARSTTNSNDPFILNDNSTRDFEIQVYRFPTSGEIAYRQDVTYQRGSIYFASGSSTNTGAVAALNVAGFGTYTAEGFATGPTTSNDLGIKLASAPPAIYEVTALGRLYASAAATTGTRTVCEFSLYDGSITRGQTYAIAAGGGATETNDGVGALIGYFPLSSQGAINVVVRAQRLTGNGTCYGEGPVQMGIRNISQQIPAPLLVGSVTSNSSGLERVERTKVTCSSSSSITSQSGSWVTSIGNISSGTCDISIDSSKWSSAPTCLTTGDIDNTAVFAKTRSTTTSMIQIFAYNSVTNSAPTSYTAQVLCMGPR
jgi:hypothetical protein